MHTFSRRRMLTSSSLGALGLLAAPLALKLELFAEEPRVVVPPYNHLTDEQEIELGRKFATQVEAQLEIVHNRMLDNYLAGIVERLARESQRPNLPYTVKLVNSNEVNAFSLAGGFLYIHRGLAARMTSEDELAATLGHELGHVVARHSINQIVRSFAARQLLNTVLSNLFKNNGVVESIIAQFGGALAMLALLHFSREDELEADMLGFYEMLRAGWDPHGFEKLFALLEEAEGQSGFNLPYLSTHPPTPAREAAVRRELAEVTIPPGARTDSISFHTFKTLMGTLPAPPTPRPSER